VIFSQGLSSKFKMNDKDFTRKRKQPFTATLLFMLNLLRKSLTIEIDGFVSYLNERLSSTTPHFSSSAFIQNRKKINPEVFRHLSEVIISNYYTKDNDGLTLFKGFRVLAVDGSRITLPCTADLKKHYGVTRNQSKVELVQARASVLYDVLNALVLDAALEHINKGERELALLHAYQQKAGDLIIYDRGYPSYDFIDEHIKSNIDFLIRVKTSHCFAAVAAFIASGKKSIVTEIYPRGKQSFKDKAYDKNTGLKVRLVRVELPGGEVEILITSLLDSNKHPHKLFKELYFLRWGIETFYDELKNKLKVEHFTGYSVSSIQQDFFCAIFISNLQSVIVNDLQEEITKRDQQRKYNYKVNTNLSYGFLKNRILELLHRQAPLESIFQELETLFLNNTIPIRNNRNNTRNPAKYRARIKPKVTKNLKNTI
jgi:hypothetical protein